MSMFFLFRIVYVHWMIQRIIEMSSGYVEFLLLLGVLLIAASTKADAKALKDAHQKDLKTNTNEAQKTKKAWLFVDPNDQRMKEAGIRIIVDTEGLKKKGLTVQDLMFLGRLGLFRQFPKWNVYQNSYVMLSFNALLSVLVPVFCFVLHITLPFIRYFIYCINTKAYTRMRYVKMMTSYAIETSCNHFFIILLKIKLKQKRQFNWSYNGIIKSGFLVFYNCRESEDRTQGQNLTFLSRWIFWFVEGKSFQQMN